MQTMRPKIFILTFLLALFGIATVYGQSSVKPFSLSNARISRVQNIGRVITTTTQINVSGWSKPVYGVSVNARIKLNESNSFVRIILNDKVGNEYLVAESNRMLNDTNRVTLSDYCEETISLSGVTATIIKVVVHNAELYLQGFNVAESIPSTVSTLSASEKNEIRKLQVEQKVAAINTFNQKHDIPWRGTVTDISLEPYSERKAAMGITSDDVDWGGFEYYRCGIFCLPSAFSSTSGSKTAVESPYVKNFDWRHRHGKNWITPAKRQFGATCWAFCAASAVEAYANLYYNQILNYDLSEQELVKNATDNSDFSGFSFKAFNYIKNNGIVLEDCMPFVFPDTTSCRCNEPSEILHIDEYCVKYSGSETINLSIDTLKKQVIQAPCPIDFYWKTKKGEIYGHAVLLIGYKQIEIGDTIDFAPYWDDTNNKVVIDNDSPYKGQTAWIIKNSIGTDWGDNGCCYFLTCDTMKISRAVPLQGKITSTVLSDKDIRITDNDGDGFYTWGLGERPKNLPIWIPLEQDGDDSDYALGPMDEFGKCQDLSQIQSDTLYIRNDTIWNTPHYIYKHVVIESGVTLVISSNVTFYQGCSLTICANGILSIEGGNIHNVTMYPQKTSSIKITAGGHLSCNKKQNFVLPLGCNLTINNGSIN